jgi:hypothetical protein
VANDLGEEQANWTSDIDILVEVDPAIGLRFVCSWRAPFRAAQMTAYRFTSAALTELRQAIIYYEQRENGLGTAFLDKIDATIDRILQHPAAGINCPHA